MISVIRKKLVVPIGIMAILVIAALSWLAFKPDEPSILGAKTAQVPVVKNISELEKLEIKLPDTTDGGYWELKMAKLAGLDEVGEMSGITGEYLLDHKAIRFVSADQGEIHWQNHQVVFKNNVVLKTIDGQQLFADKLIWDSEQKVIQAVGNVVLKAEGLIIHTTQLTARLDLNQAKFSGMTQVFSER